MAINMVLCTDFYDMIDIFSIVQFSNFRGNIRLRTEYPNEKLLQKKTQNNCMHGSVTFISPMPRPASLGLHARWVGPRVLEVLC